MSDISREVVVIDLKGRVTIPKHLREEIGLIEGGKVLLEIDREKRLLVIKPIPVKSEMCSIVFEKISDIEKLINEIINQREKLRLEIIDLRCHKNLENEYFCKILVRVEHEKKCQVLKDFFGERVVIETL